MQINLEQIKDLQDQQQIDNFCNVHELRVSCSNF